MTNTIITKKLHNHESSQCRVTISGDEINFISYTTRVVTIKHDENGNRMVECTGTYSVTTKKQMGWFLREYASDLTGKQMAEIVNRGFVAM